MGSTGFFGIIISLFCWLCWIAAAISLFTIGGGIAQALIFLTLSIILIGIDRVLENQHALHKKLSEMLEEKEGEENA